jgi:hypothetical protein
MLVLIERTPWAGSVSAGMFSSSSMILFEIDAQRPPFTPLEGDAPRAVDAWRRPNAVPRNSTSVTSPIGSVLCADLCTGTDLWAVVVV